MTLQTPQPRANTAGIRRRLAALFYEGVLLFGVLMVAGWLYAGLTQQRHALQGKHGLQAFLFVVLAIYFVWFWTHGGQTVAMKTWRVGLEQVDGRPLTQGRALARYVLAWLWILPALLAIDLTGLAGGYAAAGVVLVGVLAYAALAGLHPDRQFLHDAVCGTRLVDVRPTQRA